MKPSNKEEQINIVQQEGEWDEFESVVATVFRSRYWGLRRIPFGLPPSP